MSRKRYPIRIPRHAAGIRAQESRTGGERSWWFRRWWAALEGMGLGSRLGRGRNYALSGQVTRLEFVHGLQQGVAHTEVIAEVMGTRSEPYEVSLDFRAPPREARERIVAALKAEPMLLARLLADDLPLEVEGLFRREGLDLFPGGRLASGAERRYDMVSKCSCPDYANPCKHTAAVMMILGEEVARRPLALLELRGIAAEDLVKEVVS